ncbi:MAG: double-strand break repair protein AddB [Defluviicoccus sp.]
MSKAHVYSVHPACAFVDALAAGLLASAGPEAEALTRIQILLPTRRACRALAAAFLRLRGGQPLLLPWMRPLGDLEDDLFSPEEETTADEMAFGDALAVPPAISTLKRQLLLTRTVKALKGQATTLDQAARLARELGRLLDQVQTERRDLAGLADLITGELARHWLITVDFLAILTQRWPEILAEEGCIDPAERRNRLLEAQAHAWLTAPPPGPVYAAGTTGSVPATADLLAVVARLPQGAVILPGLDVEADDATWQAILEDPGHPQFGMANLLQRLKVDRRSVRDWPAPDRHDSDPARTRLINRALRPAACSGIAPAERTTLAGVLSTALADVTRIDCPGAEEEARIVALILRQVLETPGKTAALVTPSRPLARRVAAELQRWGIAIDDSAGRPLGSTAGGTFLRLVVATVAAEFAPIPLLATLKHPLAALGFSPATARAKARALERRALHGPRPAPGIEGLRAALDDDNAGARDLLAAIERATEPLRRETQRPRAPLLDLLHAHVETAEALAASTTETGAERLWSGDDGEAAAQFLSQLADAAAALEPIPPADYPELYDVLQTGFVVRPSFGGHPRLAIWGPLEARLQHADVMILGALNEDSWPPQVPPNPWMGRQMMKDFGLPLPERRIGLSAHDFAQAAAAPEVYLTRALREEGAPTVPSRWLLRLGLFTRGTAWEARSAAAAARWLHWARDLDTPAAEHGVEISRPAPTPPVAARPRRLSVTQIDTWMRDPYAIYARHILRLRALEPIDADPAQAEYGAVVHTALDAFLRRYPDQLPEAAFQCLLAEGRSAFGRLVDRPGVRAFWWPRFERIARWFLDEERARRPGLIACATEVEGEMRLPAPEGPFLLTAKADRIDVLADGTLAIIDYKTGTPPTKHDVAAGLSPQLPLEAAIAQAHGFPGIPGAYRAALAYWRLSGGTPPGKIEPIGSGPDLVEAAAAGLGRLVAAFDRAETPYLAQPRPAAAPRYSDYGHLARVKEWSAGTEDEG